MRTLIFAMCWTVYAVSYLCRTNLAIALPAMSHELGFSLTQGGLLGLGFFWSYAVGQLFNGYIGDRVEPRPMIALGLGISGVLNICAGSLHGFMTGIVLWSLNGFALSMLWGPAMKTVAALYYGAEVERKAIILSYSMIGGYLVSWGAIGRIISVLDWRWAFRLPGMLALGASLIWVACSSCLKITDRKTPHITQTIGDRPMVRRFPVWFCLIAAACLFQGIAKDGISLWGPTLLKISGKLDQAELSSVSLIIPVITAAGVFISGLVNKRLSGKAGVSIGLLMLASTGIGLLLAISLGLPARVIALTLGVLLALILGANTLMLGIVPLLFRSTGLVSWAAGFLDFSSYIGSAISGVITARIAQISGWSAVCVFWSVTSLISALIAFMSGRRLTVDGDCTRNSTQSSSAG